MASSSVNLNIRKFKMEDIPFKPNTADKRFGPVIVLLGKRNTGKSTILKALLYSKRDIPIGTVMSGTEHLNRFFSNFIPKILIHINYSEQAIQKMRDRQIKTLSRRLDELKQYHQSSIDTRIFIVLDDCMYDDKWTKTTLIREMFCNGRHWNIMLIITLQYPVGIPPLLRENIDFSFILRNTTLRNRRILYDNYASIFPTFELFCNVFDSLSDDFHCMVINNLTQSNQINDVVFWYRAPLELPEFRMCSEEVWARSEGIEISEETEYGPDSAHKKIKIHVTRDNTT